MGAVVSANSVVQPHDVEEEEETDLEEE